MATLHLLCAALLLYATASASTMITTSHRCRQQQQLTACRGYLRESIQPTTAAEEMINQSGWREQFMRCCPELEQVEEQCRCDAVRRMVEEQRQQGELQGREMQEMTGIAETLPALCRMGPRQCDIRGLLI